MLDVVFDTGSDWLVLETNMCDDCNGTVYDTEKSFNFKFDATNLTKKEYGDASVTGYIARDSISVGGGTYLANFPWLAITEQKGIEENKEGVLGFSRQSSAGEERSAALIADYLTINNQISRETISFLIHNDNKYSFVDFGKWDINMTKNADPDNIVWVEMPEK